MNDKQTLKELFFKNDSKLFSKKAKFVSYTCKNTTQILSTIASHNRFSQIRQRYKITKYLSKILLKSQFNWVLYAFYKNDTLYIATFNHIGQSELNMQKMTLIQYLKKTKDYYNISKVSIFRDEEKKEIIYDEVNIYSRFEERSHGIFSNELTNDKLHSIAERIRKSINKNLKLTSK